ncbi:hypothetical protein PPYR_02609 [Photinus pyralis]|uniref:DDE Tnp4 domain-containing protein n=1 Tax=Photinus pyralis TaxID=7054 RepID=A0A5N4B7Q4_PHOPY|nr:hypothetical protein PPYR_02607 [Photinus pyralis]KAB0805639.1 hypothetical protein PPYR_02609 [Photinus pyralis]
MLSAGVCGLMMLHCQLQCCLLQLRLVSLHDLLNMAKIAFRNYTLKKCIRCIFRSRTRDEAFPLKTNLLRPYSSIQQRDDIEKQIFNYRLSRARRCSENAFGILGQKFQLYNRRLKSAPEYANKIVLTTCILHNFIRAIF